MDETKYYIDRGFNVYDVGYVNMDLGIFVFHKSDLYKNKDNVKHYIDGFEKDEILTQFA